MNRRVLIGLVLLLGLPIQNAYSQASNATVSGTVHDQTKAVIPGAKLALTNTGTSVSFHTTTNDAGFYIFPGVIPGTYKLQAESAGMAKYEVTLLVQVAQSVTVDPILKPGAASTTVVIHDVTPMVNMKDSTMSTVIDRTQVDQLPRSDRQIQYLLQLVPGFVGWRAEGERFGSTHYNLDGAPMGSRSRGTIENRQPGLDSIQEMSVVSNNVSAKYNSPVEVILSTRSGTNQIHGSLFETQVNSRVGGARSRLSGNAPPPYANRAQYGVSVGGPVVIPHVYNGHDKTFWFFSYEGRRQLANSLVGYQVPTEAMRNGDFSGLVNSTGTHIKIYNPWTTNPTTYQRQQFPNNVIDPSLESPLWKKLMSYTPLPTLPNVNPLIAHNWYGNATTIWNDWTASGRIDHRFSDLDTFYARYSINGMRNDVPFNIPLTQNVANRNAYTSPAQSLALSWVHIVSPTLFNEFLASFYRQVFFQTSNPSNSQNWDSILGLPNVNGVNQWPDLLNFGLPGLAYRTVYPNADHSNFYNFDDNVTKVVGNHQLLMGVHFRHDQVNYLPQQEQAAGLFQPVANWTADWDSKGSLATPRALPYTGDLLASAFLGQGMYQSETTHQFFYERQNQYAAYFQDNWKATPRLRLNLGFRWEAWPAMHEKNNNIVGFDPSQKAVVLTQPLENYYRMNPGMAASVAILQSLGAQFIDYKQAGLPRDLVYGNWKDFSPRLGFAFRTTGGDRPLVVRGGYSMSYYPIQIYNQLEKMQTSIPYRSKPLYSPDSSGYWPDGHGGWSLRNVPTYIAGLNTANVLSAGGIAGISAGSLTTTFIDPHSPEARVQDWNFTLEKQVMPETLARVAWVGNHTDNLDVFKNLNPQTSGFVWGSNTGTAYPSGAGATRPYDSLYGDIIEPDKYGYSNYTGLQLELRRRYSHGLGYQVFYVINNAFALGKISDQGTSTTLLPPTSYLNNQVSSLNPDALDRILYYQRDSTIPKKSLTWDWVADVPVGRGKLIGRNMHGWLTAIAGGWSISGFGTWGTSWFALPAAMFPTGNKLEVYGPKYKVKDCRSGSCLSAYLWYNGYINPAQINSYGPNGKPNGIMGVPANYKPAFQPLNTDPTSRYFLTNTVSVPLKNGAVWVGNWGGIPPLQNQWVESPGLWTLSASLFKTFSIREDMKLRFQWDVFNPTNSPERPQIPQAPTGLLYTYYNGQSPRSMQFTLRLLW